MKKEQIDEIKILHEDKDFLALNKQAGLIVHYDGKTKEQNLADWLVKRYPNLKNVGEPWEKDSENGEKSRIIYRPGIVHRLDRETSGVIVIAKNQKAFEFLKNQFQNREVSKTYHAFVYGKVKEDSDIIDRPIGRSRKDFRMYSAQRGMRGMVREAVTEYKVLRRSDERSLLELIPKTGRTHQIRVHLKAINHPVICDSLYAPKQKCDLGFERLALHSIGLSFKSSSGEEISIKAPYPSDFEKALELFDSAEK